jgi:DNA-binding transcriptional LysR family regulator
MQIQQVHHFLAAVTYGNLGRAAAYCNITQPAITRSIQRLEEVLGIQLLERSGRGVAPTEAGKVMFEYARQLVRDTRLVRQRLADMSGHDLAEIRVGISANFSHEGLATAFAKVMRKWPNRNVSISMDFCSSLIQRLSAGEVDLIVALVPDSLDEQDFEIRHLFDIPGGVVVGPKHPLRNQGTVPLAQLAKYKWIALETETAGYLSRKFGPFDLRAPDVPVRTDSPVLMKQLLLASELVGLAPLRLFADEVASGELVRLANELDPLTARGCLVHRKGSDRSPQLYQFIDEFHAALRTTIASPIG